MARDPPVLPEATLVRPLSAQLKASKAEVCYVRSTSAPAARRVVVA